MDLDRCCQLPRRQRPTGRYGRPRRSGAATCRLRLLRRLASRLLSVAAAGDVAGVAPTSDDATWAGAALSGAIPVKPEVDAVSNGAYPSATPRRLATPKATSAAAATPSAAHTCRRRRHARIGSGLRARAALLANATIGDTVLISNPAATAAAAPSGATHCRRCASCRQRGRVVRHCCGHKATVARHAPCGTRGTGEPRPRSRAQRRRGAATGGVVPAKPAVKITTQRRRFRAEGRRLLRRACGLRKCRPTTGSWICLRC